MTLSPSYEPIDCHHRDIDQFSDRGRPQKTESGEQITHPAYQGNRLVFLLLKSTGPWVAGGITIMLAGTAVVQVAVLPRIYTCPGGAVCRHAFNPTSNVLQFVQTLMTYWLHVGTLVAGCGLVKLLAYRSWFSMKRDGRTIEGLHINLAVLQGSAWNALLLLRFGRHNRSSGIFALVQIAIVAAISLVVGFSISRVGTRDFAWAEFSYPTNLTLSLGVSQQQQLTFAQLGFWLLKPNESARQLDRFQGTLVVRDNRTRYAILAQPTGSRISSDIVCSAENIHSVVPRPLSMNQDGTCQQYNITLKVPHSNPTQRYHERSDTFLSVVTVTFDTYGNPLYLWASNTTGILPNSTASHDKRLHTTLCNHSVSLSQTQHVEETQSQYLSYTSAFPFFPLTAKGIPNWVARNINSWWTSDQIQPTGELRPISCESGVFMPISSKSKDTHLCQVNATTWAATVTAMLDAGVETAEKTGSATQRLQIMTESINRKRWWIQAVIPLATLALYVASLVHTLYVIKDHGSLEELTLCAVVAAGHLHGECGILQQGELDYSKITVGGTGSGNNLVEHKD